MVKKTDNDNKPFEELSSISEHEGILENEKSMKEMETQFRRFLMDQMLGADDKMTIVEPFIPGSIP